MFSRGSCYQDVLGVQVGGCGDVHRVDVRSVAHIFDTRVTPRRILLPKAVDHSRIGVGSSHDRRIRISSDSRHRSGGSTAKPDYAEAKHDPPLTGLLVAARSV